MDQVDKILGNTDVVGRPEMLAAYKLWEHEQAQQGLSAAYENVVDMDSYRQTEDDKESAA
jgi:hypothetical protein